MHLSQRNPAALLLLPAPQPSLLILKKPHLCEITLGHLSATKHEKRNHFFHSAICLSKQSSYTIPAPTYVPCKILLPNHIHSNPFPQQFLLY